MKDITLAFYPGAKIGVLGPNGAGKSSLARIMAGLDEEFSGDARLTDGFTVGLLEQEPGLNLIKEDVPDNVMEGLGEISSLLSQYDGAAAWADPEADYGEIR